MSIPVKCLLPRLIVAAMAAAALAGCGSAASTSTATNEAGGGAASATQTSTSTHATSTHASSTGAASTSRTVTPTGGPGECRAAQLTLSYLGGLGATGHGDLGFALRNRSTRSCHTYGYPGIQFLDRMGKSLPTQASHSTDDFFGHSLLRSLSVAPGHSVSFRLDVSHGSGTPGRCPTAAALRVIPPDDTRALRTAITNGAYECGHAIVSPLQPGHSAHP
ncbi:MAG: hypothetical protein QOF83_854 [Solirubrobacteraceae bacterium]|jgi:uncharacterized protein YceK|nr:hypothetical protein [Solirubrobacteraceae bacterium]